MTIFAGRYELCEQLGHGATGTVWLAHDRKKGTDVAVKILHHGDHTSLIRFVKEQALRISDPHVLSPLSWAADDDQVLFSMPIAGGGSLATLMGDYGAIPVRYCAEVLRQIFAGLRAVHAAGVVHRDIKPANILLEATGSDRPHAYVSDFSIAADLNGPRLTQTTMVLGTPGYMAPEQATGAAPVPAMDIYAVGAVGYDLLVGTPGSGSADLAPGTNAALVNLLARCTDVDPVRRPTAAQALEMLTAEPHLAWDTGAAGDIDVLQQISTVGPDGTATIARELQPTRVMFVSPTVGSDAKAALKTPPQQSGELVPTLAAEPRTATPVQQQAPLLPQPVSPPGLINVTAGPRIQRGFAWGRTTLVFASLTLLIGCVVVLVQQLRG